MRDPELMLDLLREMAESADGRMMVVQRFGMSEDERKRIHHIEMLSDASHVDWLSDSMARITNEGYDFLQAIQQGDTYRTKFIERINKGIEYVRVAAEIIKLVQQAAPPIA